MVSGVGLEILLGRASVKRHRRNVERTGTESGHSSAALGTPACPFVTGPLGIAGGCSQSSGWAATWIVATVGFLCPRHCLNVFEPATQSKKAKSSALTSACFRSTSDHECHARCRQQARSSGSRLRTLPPIEEHNAEIRTAYEAIPIKICHGKSANTPELQ